MSNYALGIIAFILLLINSNVVNFQSRVFFVPCWKPCAAVFPEIFHRMTVPVPRPVTNPITEEPTSNCHVKDDLEL